MEVLLLATQPGAKLVERHSGRNTCPGRHDGDRLTLVEEIITWLFGAFPTTDPTGREQRYSEAWND